MRQSYMIDVRPGELLNIDGEWIAVVANYLSGFSPGGAIELATGEYVHYRYSCGIVNVRSSEFVQPA